MLTCVTSWCHNVTTMFDVYTIWTDTDGVLWIGPDDGMSTGLRVRADGSLIGDHVTMIRGRLDAYTVQP